MRGREIYARFRIIIQGLELFFRILPFCIKDVLWTLVSSWRGKLGILIRYLIARTSSESCGEVVLIGPGVEIRSWKDLSIGSNVSIHKGCYLDATGGIRIGSEVSIAHNTSILTFEHTWEDLDKPIRSNPCCLKPVEIKDDVWIGCGCRILAGVMIGSRCVVAAGAVLVSDVKSGTVVGGVPARELKAIS